MAKLILEYAFEHERLRRDEPFLTQPMGHGEVDTFTWGQTMDQARRMATHLKARGFEPGARIAMLAKNSALTPDQVSVTVLTPHFTRQSGRR